MKRRRRGKVKAPVVLQRIYLDASSWNALTNRADRHDVILALTAAGTSALPSVINLGEILNTTSPERLSALASTIQSMLNGSQPVLDHPDRLLESAAWQWVDGKTEFTVAEERGAALLRDFIAQPNAMADDDRALVRNWIAALNSDLDNFLREIRPQEKIIESCLPDPSWIRSSRFMESFQLVPQAASLGMTTERLTELCDGSDIWLAFRAEVCYSIDMALAHTPRRFPEGGKRPSGADMRQAVYLALADAFVADDRRLCEAMQSISALLAHPRPVLSLENLLADF